MDTAEDHRAEPRRVARFTLATMLVTVTAIAIGLFLFLETSKVEVTAYLQVKRLRSDSGWPKVFSDAETDEEYGNFKRTQVELMRSKSNLTRALRDPAIYGVPSLQVHRDPVGWLQENLKFDYPNDGELLRVRLLTGSPMEGMKVVDAVVNCYFKEVVERGVLDRAKTEQKLREISARADEQLLLDKHEQINLRRALGERAATSPELEVRERRIAIQQEAANEIDRQLQRLLIIKQMPSRVQKLDDATATP
ncbi:MAG TPA: hypothetical protein VGN12_13310 [Pirellulales bacterium]|jgi:hypothetical protein